MQIEPDARHVELILQSLGLWSDGGWRPANKVKPLAAPSVKVTDDELEKWQRSPQLMREQAAVDRSNVRSEFLSARPSRPW